MCLSTNVSAICCAVWTVSSATGACVSYALSTSESLIASYFKIVRKTIQDWWAVGTAQWWIEAQE